MIKKLNKEYLKELIKLNKLAFKPLEKELGKYSEKGVEDYFEFTFREGVIFGYFIDKELVGCVGIVMDKKFKFGEVEHLLVNPEFQGNGVAKKLVGFIENYAKKKDIKELRLNVRHKNTKAIGFYEYAGYFKHAYIMKKELK